MAYIDNQRLTTTSVLESGGNTKLNFSRNFRDLTEFLETVINELCQGNSIILLRVRFINYQCAPNAPKTQTNFRFKESVRVFWRTGRAAGGEGGDKKEK